MAIVLLPALFYACSQPGKETSMTGALDSIPYDLSNPEVVDLADDLHEVSGISPTGDDSTLLAINDERGSLFLIDLRGTILSEKKFRKGGDYEDLVVVDSSVYVLTSNGNLHFIPDWHADSLHSKAYKSEFKDGIEFESLALDPVANRLLMLVKDGEGRQGKAPVYAFDLLRKAFIPDPVMLVDPKTIRQMTVKGKSLRGSAMSRNPITGHWYAVTAIQHMLLVFDNNGNGLFAWKLPKKKFPQPEGLCFMPNGDMMMTTEGLSKAAKLYRFRLMR
ncbi:MAG: hypothetical protein ACKO3B_09240 [Bacteroidota bacterium]